MATIVGLQLDDMDVDSVKDGEIRLKLDVPVKKQSKLWRKNSS
jgi:hypothetical protein